MLTNIHSARIYAVHALTVASPANEKSIHSARMYAAQALISAHPAKGKDYRLRKNFPQPRSADKLLIYYPQ